MLDMYKGIKFASKESKMVQTDWPIFNIQDMENNPFNRFKIPFISKYL